jgi:hypothetical protein
MPLTAPEKFRLFRDRCLRWAKTATAEDEHMFLDMADSWEMAARQLEQSVESIAQSREMVNGTGNVSRARSNSAPPDEETAGDSYRQSHA